MPWPITIIPGKTLPRGSQDADAAGHQNPGSRFRIGGHRIAIIDDRHARVAGVIRIKAVEDAEEQELGAGRNHDAATVQNEIAGDVIAAAEVHIARLGEQTRRA